MTGNMEKEMDYGVIPNVLARMFTMLQSINSKDSPDLKPPRTFEFQLSYLELYNGKCRDLLVENRLNLNIKESNRKTFYVKDLSMWPVHSFEEARDLLIQGMTRREVKATELNTDSSRSHSILTIHVRCNDSTRGVRTESKLNLVDLAGSERQAKTQAEGEILQEGAKINLSLSALGTVIDCIVRGRSHIPYRSSPLTMLLKDALGGSSRTVLFGTIGPADINGSETISTLRFVDRAKHIQNRPKLMMDPKDAKILELTEEVARLKKRLRHYEPVDGGDNQSVKNVDNEADDAAYDEDDEENEGALIATDSSLKRKKKVVKRKTRHQSSALADSESAMSSHDSPHEPNTGRPFNDTSSDLPQDSGLCTTVGAQRAVSETAENNENDNGGSVHPRGNNVVPAQIQSDFEQLVQDLENENFQLRESLLIQREDAHRERSQVDDLLQQLRTLQDDISVFQFERDDAQSQVHDAWVTIQEALIKLDPTAPVGAIIPCGKEGTSMLSEMVTAFREGICSQLSQLAQRIPLSATETPQGTTRTTHLGDHGTTELSTVHSPMSHTDRKSSVKLKKKKKNTRSSLVVQLDTVLGKEEGAEFDLPDKTEPLVASTSLSGLERKSKERESASMNAGEGSPKRKKSVSLAGKKSRSKGTDSTPVRVPPTHSPSSPSGAGPSKPLRDGGMDESKMEQGTEDDACRSQMQRRVEVQRGFLQKAQEQLRTKSAQIQDLTKELNALRDETKSLKQGQLQTIQKAQTALATQFNKRIEDIIYQHEQALRKDARLKEKLQDKVRRWKDKYQQLAREYDVRVMERETIFREMEEMKVDCLRKVRMQEAASSTAAQIEWIASRSTSFPRRAPSETSTTSLHTVPVAATRPSPAAPLLFGRVDSHLSQNAAASHGVLVKGTGGSTLSSPSHPGGTNISQSGNVRTPPAPPISTSVSFALAREVWRGNGVGTSTGNGHTKVTPSGYHTVKNHTLSETSPSSEGTLLVHRGNVTSAQGSADISLPHIRARGPNMDVSSEQDRSAPL